MSSFEPLFATPDSRRITPPVLRAIGSANAWMPVQVSAPEPARPSLFDTSIEDELAAEEAAERAAAEAVRLAEVAARQAALDAAYLRGVEDGRTQGELAERARLRGAALATERALDDLRAGEARWLHNLEENIAAVAVGVAQHVVQREVTTNASIVRTIVTRAVQEFGLDQALIIRVNPGDHESLQSAAREGDPDELRTAIGPREVRWVADARIEPGGCVVEGRDRIVDGRVDTGLERLYRRLTYTNA